MFGREVIVPVCVAACACNAFFAIAAGYQFSEGFSPGLNALHWINPIGTTSGALAGMTALALTIALVESSQGRARAQAKAAVALLLVSPFAWWTLVWPALLRTSCIGDACYGSTAYFIGRAAVLDIDQAQLGLAIIATTALLLVLRSARAPARVS